MKIKNFIVLDDVFVNALIHFNKLHLPVRISYPLIKCLDVLKQEEVRVKTARDELIRKYGQHIKNEQGEVIKIDIAKAPVQDQQKFLQEVNDLVNMEFEVPLEEKIKVKLDELAEFKVSPEYLVKMRVFLDVVE